jgi:multidrug resistance efflux pump
VKVVNLGISGQIISIAVKEGNAVSIGQVLAELDHRNAQLSYNIAKSKADLTAVKLSRDEAIMSSQGISKQQLDITKSEYIVSQSNLKMAELALERTYIKSPCNGVIIQKTATAGNVLEGSQVAFTIVDIDNAWISANINEKQVSKI